MKSFTQYGRIGDIPEAQWQALRRDDYPFLDYHFLRALEDNGCIGEDSGWNPACITAHNENGDIELIIPLFHKFHSYGEYVFDWGWADAYQRHGLQYYPKLLWAIPFTPASGPRLLYKGDPEPAWQAALAVVQQVCDEQTLSGWHLNFFPERDLPRLQKQPGVLLRSACQYHWYNRHYRDFEHYLEHFTSRKRKSVRKERQKVADAGIRIQRLDNTRIRAEDITFFYRCYQLTYRKRGQQGYLNLRFFQQLRETMASQMLLVIAHQQDKPVAAALYFHDSENLYGRYWGCTSEIDGLHFEACYYQGIEFCIERGLAHFDPGTQGEHKISRGFEPTLTHSAHHLQHPAFQDAVGRFIEEEQQQVLTWQAEAANLLPFNETALQIPRGCQPRSVDSSSVTEP
jgi:uncharacterized protein